MKVYGSCVLGGCGKEMQVGQLYCQRLAISPAFGYPQQPLSKIQGTAGAVSIVGVFNSAFTLIGAGVPDRGIPMTICWSWSHLQSRLMSRGFLHFYSLVLAPSLFIQAIASLSGRNRPLPATTLGAVVVLVLPSSHY